MTNNTMTQTVEPKAATVSYFRDWPNDAGFNAMDEQHEARELKVHGQLPAWAVGSLYRTGPGAYRVKRAKAEDGEFVCSHWFDGFAHMHKFDIVAQPEGNPKVFYTSRSQVDKLLVKVRETGKIDGITFGQKRDPCDSFFKKVKCFFEPAFNKGPNEANIHVAIHKSVHVKSKNSLLPSVLSQEPPSLLSVTTDMGATKEFNPITLEPLGITEQQQLHPGIKGHFSGAHAPKDPITGDMFNYNLKVGRKAIYEVFRTDATTGETDILATVSESTIPGAYIHSMFITENFLILCIWPAIYTMSGASILWERNLLNAMKFDPTQKTTWLVVDRSKHRRGLVSSFVSPAMFAFHTVNAWEDPRDDGNVDLICELVEYKDMSILQRLYYDNMVSSGSGVQDYAGKSTTHTKLNRYRLANVPLHAQLDSDPSGTTTTQPRTADVIQTISAPQAGELPRINEKYATRPHRYVYTVIDRGLSSFIDAICKTDTLTGTCLIWDHARHTPGEAVFLARPPPPPPPPSEGGGGGGGGGAEEDDGILLSVVLDGDRGTSYLLCLDARDMSEIARAECGVAVGIGFQGLHLPEETT